MPRRADLIGIRFGRIVIQQLSHVDKRKSAMWIGLCDCGSTTRPIPTTFLKKGKVTSCGCYRKEIVGQLGRKSAKDLTGQIFGRLTALEPTEKRYGSSIIWKCLCICGNFCEANSNNLQKGTKVSCGCYQKEVRKENGKKIGPLCAKNLIGEVFGYLTALRPTEKRYFNSVVWECLCICGHIHEASSHNLLSGYVTSCGCRTRSNLHENVRNSLVNIGIEIHSEEFPIHLKNFDLGNRKSTLYVDLIVKSSSGEGLIAIECQGRQHYRVHKDFWGGEEGYQKRLKCDSLKKECLKRMSIPLIEVRYDEPNIEAYLRNELLSIK